MIELYRTQGSSNRSDYTNRESLSARPQRASVTDHEGKLTKVCAFASVDLLIWNCNFFSVEMFRLIDDKPIPHARFGKEISRLGGVVFEFPTQARHEDTKVMVLLSVMRSPHFSQEEPMCQHLSGVF